MAEETVAAVVPLKLLMRITPTFPTLGIDFCDKYGFTDVTVILSLVSIKSLLLPLLPRCITTPTLLPTGPLNLFATSSGVLTPSTMVYPSTSTNRSSGLIPPFSAGLFASTSLANICLVSLFMDISMPTPARVPVAESTMDWSLAGDRYRVYLSPSESTNFEIDSWASSMDLYFCLRFTASCLIWNQSWLLNVRSMNVLSTTRHASAIVFCSGLKEL
mmetsp:Transcript_53316/g.79225  ORF Transcript_53316/g.79225 Transcript_53316/m.79225 type:complete len:217 (-) Transcript_53316:725-1375(-)